MKDRLFVPLNKHWYDLFLEGKKKWEIRGLSNRFNRQTVRVGRDVELRRGYAKEGAVWGKIVEVHITSTVYISIMNIMDDLFPIPTNSPLWNEIQEYNTKYSEFIVFKIDINESTVTKGVYDPPAAKGKIGPDAETAHHECQECDDEFCDEDECPKSQCWQITEGRKDALAQCIFELEDIMDDRPFFREEIDVLRAMIEEAK